ERSVSATDEHAHVGGQLVEGDEVDLPVAVEVERGEVDRPLSRREDHHRRERQRRWSGRAGPGGAGVAGAIAGGAAALADGTRRAPAAAVDVALVAVLH